MKTNKELKEELELLLNNGVYEEDCPIEKIDEKLRDSWWKYRECYVRDEYKFKKWYY